MRPDYTRTTQSLGQCLTGRGEGPSVPKIKGEKPLSRLIPTSCFVITTQIIAPNEDNNTGNTIMKTKMKTTKNGECCIWRPTPMAKRLRKCSNQSSVHSTWVHRICLKVWNYWSIDHAVGCEEDPLPQKPPSHAKEGITVESVSRVYFCS